MTIGTLLTAVVLDHPVEVHCGPSSLVSGHVQLRFVPEGLRGTGTPELFGPLRLSVVFHGRAKSKIVKRSNNTTHVYRGRAPLFSITQVIHDGPIKVSSQKPENIPFVVQFPESIQPFHDQGSWLADPRFPGGPGQPLPPSMHLDHHAVGRHFECFTEYRVGTTASMRQIDVKISPSSGDDERMVYYEQPYIPTDIASDPKRNTARDIARIQNEFLLPESDRPSGFKQKAKAFFSSDYYPFYHFEIRVNAPSEIHLGEPLEYMITIVPFKSSTAPLVPKITLLGYEASIKAYTEVRSEAGGLFSVQHESHGDETAIYASGSVDDRGPFREENDLTKTVTIPKVQGIPSTFSTFNIIRTYKLKIKFTVEAATKTTRVEAKFPLTILPPLDRAQTADASSSAAPIAGPSNPVPDDERQALPVYEQPPGYNFTDKNGSNVGPSSGGVF